MCTDQYTLIEQSTWIIDCLDKCEHTLLNSIANSFETSSLFLITSLTLENIFSHDDKAGFAV